MDFPAHPSLQDDRRQPPVDRPRAARRRRPPAALLFAICTVAASWFSPADVEASSFDFADYVAERNLTAAAGSGRERFSEGQDSIDRFNGALGYTVPLGATYPVGGLLSYQLRLVYSSNFWDFELDSGSVAAHPGARFNAGLGWSLSFGELLAPATAANPTNFWVYRDPEGRRTRFYATFDDSASSTPGVFYSRDGSYKRLRVKASTASVDSPNGLIHSFQVVAGSWRLVSMSDPFANFVAIDYSQSDRWTLSDSHGRTQVVHLRADPSGVYDALIDRVELAAFDGGTATYQLVYQTSEVMRPRQDEDSATPLSSPLPLLRRVEPPLGNASIFSYYLPRTPQDIRSGRLYQVRLPTLGKIRYWYEEVQLPFLDGAEHAADVVGVWRRRTFGLDGSLVGTWRLTQALDVPRLAGDPDQPRELTRGMIYPDGHEQRHKFSVYVSGDSANGGQPPLHFERSEYGLPFTKIGARSAEAALLGTETFTAAGLALESSSVRFEQEPCDGCWDFRSRFVETRHVRHDLEGDNDWSLITSLSDFDGLGHFRTTTVSDELGGPLGAGSAAARTTFTAYLGERPEPAEPWILGVHEGRTTSQGAESRTEEVCVDAATGLRRRARTWAGDQRGPNDLLRVYEPDPSGNLAVIRHYGGDVQTLATQYADLCAMALPPQEQYAAFREYRFGAVSRSGWLAADGSVFLVEREATIDPGTGRVAGESRADGLWTSYAYDALGRQTLVTPPAGHGESSTHVYAPADAATGAAWELHVVREDASGQMVGESRSFGDGFGRTTAVSNRGVDGWVDLFTEYDAMGRTVSMTGPDGAVVHYAERDAYGRPLVVEHAGGATYLETFSYGPRSTSRTVRIGKRWNEQTGSVELLSRTTTTTQDQKGRTVARRVEDEDGEWRLEQSTYNLAGRVVTTTTTDGIRSSSTELPDRRDDRGFLVEDASGAAIVGYDALGHLTVEATVNGTIANVFDRAGRLVERREGSPTGTLWLRNTFATSNGAGDYRQGKLWKALRRNYGVPHLPGGRVDVEETYAYGGDGGRLSQVTTRVTAGAGGALELFTFSTSQAFDTAGRLEQLSYPDCVVDASNSTAQCTPLPERRLDFAYDFGALRRVDGTLGAGNAETWIESITYDSSGVPAERVLGNGTVEVRTPDASGGGRLADMTISHPTHGSFYTSGLAEYDGNGKLVKLGSQRRISDNAYSLALLAPPPPTGDPSPPAPAFYGDLLGRSPQRSYRIPSRNAAFSTDGVEDVWEIHVYGPRGRLWTRKFNDFDAWNYNRSRDEWYLLDPSGRRVRTRVGRTRYQGIRQVTYANAEVSELQIYVALERHADAIYARSELIARTDSIANSPWRVFYHRDIRGHTFATTDDEGEAELNRAPIQ